MEPDSVRCLRRSRHYRQRAAYQHVAVYLEHGYVGDDGDVNSAATLAAAVAAAIVVVVLWIVAGSLH